MEHAVREYFVDQCIFKTKGGGKKEKITQGKKTGKNWGGKNISS